MAALFNSFSLYFRFYFCDRKPFKSVHKSDIFDSFLSFVSDGFQNKNALKVPVFRWNQRFGIRKEGECFLPQNGAGGGTRTLPEGLKKPYFTGFFDFVSIFVSVFPCFR